MDPFAVQAAAQPFLALRHRTEPGWLEVGRVLRDMIDDVSLATQRRIRLPLVPQSSTRTFPRGWRGRISTPAAHRTSFGLPRGTSPASTLVSAVRGHVHRL